MNGLVLIGLAFTSVFLVTVTGWRRGLCLCVAWGYLFGILKSNYVHSWGHFIYDGAVVGLYAGVLFRPPTANDLVLDGPVRGWLKWLIGWPLFLFFVPVQHFLIQAVGLRGNVLFMPLALFGAWLGETGRRGMALTLSAMNLMALAFASAEFSMGVEAFFPRNEATEIIYKSQDIAGDHFRIPATFANAHSYGGTMTLSLPWILGGLFQRARNPVEYYLLGAGLIAAGIGIFLCGARMPVALAGLMVGLSLMTRRLSLPGVAFLGVAAIVVFNMVQGEERMQRFATLQDTEAVVGRISISVNEHFFDLLAEYPLGNGLGGGGTSIPYFLQHLLHKRVGLENEYSRVLVEQGVFGLLIFVGFVLWFFTRRLDSREECYATRRLLWFSAAIALGTSFIGVGLMTSVPGTSLIFLAIGFAAARVGRVGDVEPGRGGENDRLVSPDGRVAG